MRALMIGICVLIIPTFIAWGGYAGKMRRAAREAERESLEAQTVASVGGTPILAREFQQRLRSEAERMGRRGKIPTLEEMANDGTAERVLDGLIDSVLIDHEVQKSGFAVDRDFLVQQLKKESAFQDERGNFNPAAWNQWVEMDPSRNWNPIYAEVAQQVAREMLFQEAVAPARVLDSGVKRKFEESYTKLQVKYVTIDPKIVPTPEQIQVQYDKDPSTYAIPEKRDVEFVAISLAPPRPAVLDEILKRARNNEDFGALAKEYSKDPTASNGGDMGWVEQKPESPPYLAALFTVPVGGVSDAVQSGTDYYIFKIDEEKKDEATGVRSVKARKILVRVQLDEAERAARGQKAEAVDAKAKEAGDLSAAAAEAGLTVMTAKGLSSESVTAENVAQEDTFAFLKGLAGVDKGSVSDIIKARMNLYVVKVTDTVPPVAQPLDAVRERVTQDAIESIRRSPEHADEVKKLAGDIAAKAHSLKEVLEGSPQLGLEVKESKEFAGNDFIAGDLMVQARDVYESVGSKDVGAFAGPLRGYRGEQYFIELAKKTPPTEENWKTDWPKDEPNLRKSAIAAKQGELLNDYLAYLRERAGSEIPIQRNYEAIAKVLGADKETDQQTTDEEEQPSTPPMPVTTTHDPMSLGPPASE
jgi:hypothetical protein